MKGGTIWTRSKPAFTFNFSLPTFLSWIIDTLFIDFTTLMSLCGQFYSFILFSLNFSPNLNNCMDESRWIVPSTLKLKLKDKIIHTPTHPYKWPINSRTRQKLQGDLVLKLFLSISSWVSLPIYFWPTLVIYISDFAPS